MNIAAEKFKTASIKAVKAINEAGDQYLVDDKWIVGSCGNHKIKDWVIFFEGKEEKDSCLQKIEMCGSDARGWFPCVLAWVHEDEVGFYRGVTLHQDVSNEFGIA